MPSPSPQRVAALAVRRYGVDRAKVGSVFDTIQRANGQAADMLHALMAQGLLTPQQGQELLGLLEPAAPIQHAETAMPDVTDDFLLPPVPPEGEPAVRSLAGFRILRRLGEGSMGIVYLGYHQAQERRVAIKVLPDWLATHPTCVERFYREARNSTLLAHPHIVRGYCAGYDGASGKHYLVREFVDGVSGQVLLDRLGRVPVGAAVQIVLDVTHALDYLHERKYVHRDIKPDNVLIERSGLGKLADLGLLQRTDEPNRGGTALRGFGTSYYMPHEQALGSRRLDGRSDIYALGATLYHMVTGEVPFPGDTHQEIVDKKAAGQFRPASAVNPQLPAELDAILGRMLARQPEQRYPSATALRADLERSGLARPATSCPSLAPILHGHEPVGEAQHPETRTRPDFALLPDDAESAAGALGWLRRVARLAGPSLMIGAGLVTALLVLLAATGLVIAQALLLD